jgi:hypothetical protein
VNSIHIMDGLRSTNIHYEQHLTSGRVRTIAENKDDKKGCTQRQNKDIRLLSETQDYPGESSISSCDGENVRSVCSKCSGRVAVEFENRGAGNSHTVGTWWKGAFPRLSALELLEMKFVPHHGPEYPVLIVDLGNPASPKDIEDCFGNKESIDAHPKTVCESDQRQREDKVGDDG